MCSAVTRLLIEIWSLLLWALKTLFFPLVLHFSHFKIPSVYSGRSAAVGNELEPESIESKDDRNGFGLIYCDLTIFQDKELECVVENLHKEVKQIADAASRLQDMADKEDMDARAKKEKLKNCLEQLVKVKCGDNCLTALLVSQKSID